MEADEFGRQLPGWKESNSMPWGRLRYDTAWMNIARHTDDRTLRILDVGGGDGVNAIHYAKMGHSVTLIDCSPAMLAEAGKSAEEQGVAEKLTLCQTEPDALPCFPDEQPFDLIICHMMIEFVPDARSLFRGMCEALVPGGLLSLLDTNRYSDVYMKALQMKSLADAMGAVGANEYFHPWVNRLIPRFSADEFIDQLDENGCSLTGHYGVLNICAYLPNEPKYDPQYYSELEELERRMTDRYPYNLVARFFQIIARKN